MNRVCVPGQTLRRFLQTIVEIHGTKAAAVRPMKMVLQLQSALALALVRLFKATEHRSERYAKLLAPTMLVETSEDATDGFALELLRDHCIAEENQAGTEIASSAEQTQTQTQPQTHQ